MEVAQFLVAYCFDLEQSSAEPWVSSWQDRFPSNWIPLATVEALYQGRYKAASIDRILRMWEQRGSPRLTFTSDFTRKVWPDKQTFFQTALQQGFLTAQERRWYPSGFASSFSISSYDLRIEGQDLVQQLQTQTIPPRLQQLLTRHQTANP